MATRETSKQAARRRAKTNPADERAARSRRAKAPGAPAWLTIAGVVAAREDAHEPSPLVAVDVLWAAVMAGRAPRAEAPAPPVAPRAETPAPPAAEVVALRTEAPAPTAAEVVAPRAETTTPPATEVVAPAPRGETVPPGPPGAEAAEPALEAAARQRRIARRAYALAEANGFRIAPFDAWLRAEREVDAGSV